MDDHELEFVSDGFDVNGSSQDDFDIDAISKELGQLGVNSNSNASGSTTTTTNSENNNDKSKSSTSKNGTSSVEIDDSWEEQMRKELEEEVNAM